MVNHSEQLDRVFGALSDPTRRAMVAQLAQGPASIGELGEPFAMSKPAVTKHVKVLERAGLLSREVDGRVHRCEIDPAPLDEAQAWVDQVREHWGHRLDDLAHYLDNVQRRSRR
ncbi:MAG: metalloregulator ArsR/SmtB family transcription factor [Myxococcota bacterium]